MKICCFFATLFISVNALAQEPRPQCPDRIVDRLYNDTAGEIRLECSLEMKPDSVIRKQVLLEGENASNIRIDCAGSRLERGLKIYSRKQTDETGQVSWSVPLDIRVSNCITGAITHVYGMGINGEGEDLTDSSRREGHTERVQANAPSGIHFDQFTTETSGAIPFYFGPGVTNSSITNSLIRGSARSVAIYLDAESGQNLISGNTFTISTGRELIAVDGSANNRIADNRFNSLSQGGIYLYRNCGEGGNIRHQAPQNNLIEGNRFYYDKYRGRNPGVWLGSRDGNRNYCDHDEGYELGSSADDRDFANNNRVTNNTFVKFLRIRNDGENNLIENNQVENPGQCFLMFCW